MPRDAEQAAGRLHGRRERRRRSAWWWQPRKARDGTAALSLTRFCDLYSAQGSPLGPAAPHRELGCPRRRSSADQERVTQTMGCASYIGEGCEHRRHNSARLQTQPGGRRHARPKGLPCGRFRACTRSTARCQVGYAGVRGAYMPVRTAANPACQRHGGGAAGGTCSSKDVGEGIYPTN